MRIKREIQEHVRLLYVRGVEGNSLYLNDYRIKGPKPWGGGSVINSWEAIKTEDIAYAIGYEDKISALESALADAEAEITKLSLWVNDLQSGMYVNCVYCGHRYGPKENTPVSMADILKQHIETCPKHPMFELKNKNAELVMRCEALEEKARRFDKAREVCMGKSAEEDSEEALP